MKTKLSIKTRISAVRLNNSYHIKVELENKYYIHNYPFHSLLDAVDFTSKILEVKEIDLLHWKTENSEFDIWEKFLICNRSKEDKTKKAHLWNGLDTFCNMWSTGGLGYKYDLFNTDLHRDICTMCFNKKRKLDHEIDRVY